MTHRPTVGPMLGLRCGRWPTFGSILVLMCRVCWDIDVQILAFLPLSQQTRHIETILVDCWASAADSGPTLNQHCFNVSCLLGSHLNFHPLEIVSRLRDPQRQVGEKYSICLIQD